MTDGAWVDGWAETDRPPMGRGGGAGGENGWEQTRRPCWRWRRLGEWVLRDRPPVLELVNKMGGDRKAAREVAA